MLRLLHWVETLENRRIELQQVTNEPKKAGKRGVIRRRRRLFELELGFCSCIIAVLANSLPLIANRICKRLPLIAKSFVGVPLVILTLVAIGAIVVSVIASLILPSLNADLKRSRIIMN